MCPQEVIKSTTFNSPAKKDAKLSRSNTPTFDTVFGSEEVHVKNTFYKSKLKGLYPDKTLLQSC